MKTILKITFPYNKKYLYFLFVGILACINSYSQINSETEESKRHIYRPKNTIESEIIAQPDSGSYTTSADAENNLELLNQKQDSIYKREIFISDSIRQRKKTIDSLLFLQQRLPKLFEAGLYAQIEQLIVEKSDISIKGDSALNNFTYIILPYSFNQPYTPWITSINLAANSFTIGVDTIHKKITSIKAPQINWSYTYGSNSNILRIDEPSIVKQKNGKKYYTIPFDSVFFDTMGRVVKIKRYSSFYQANDKYQKGSFLFTDLYRVKQFEYNPQGVLLNYQLIDFSDRWSTADPVKVSTIVKFTISKISESYKILRQNDPKNDYSDGTFLFEFDIAHNLKSVSFQNFKNTEKWKTSIELNELGYVSRYVYEVNGNINSTLLINYFPNGKGYRYETITCTFENDGISYYQKNNTTGKSRVRDKFTGEWSSWQ